MSNGTISSSNTLRLTWLTPGAPHTVHRACAWGSWLAKSCRQLDDQTHACYQRGTSMQQGPQYSF